jgi:hypothetical protein
LIAQILHEPLERLLPAVHFDDLDAVEDLVEEVNALVALLGSLSSLYFFETNFIIVYRLKNSCFRLLKVHSTSGKKRTLIFCQNRFSRFNLP